MEDGTIRASAIKLAEQGFSVFRLFPGKKFPRHKAYYDRALRDPEQVRKAWSDDAGWPEQDNIGVLTGAVLPNGHRLHVIDVDNKPDRSGWDALDELKMLGLNEKTFTVKTPSGGLHLYYSVPADWPELSNTAEKLGHGLDTRGYHGYVLGPGSRIGDKTYEIEQHLPIEPMPRWLYDMLQPRKEKKADDPTRWVVEPDSDPAIAHAVEYARSYPPTQGGRRNDQVMMLARDLRDRGVSSEVAKSIIREHWPIDWTDFSDAELEKTVESSYRTANQMAGTLAADYQFEDATSELPSDATHPIELVRERVIQRNAGRFATVTIKDLMTRPRPKWLVKHWFQAGGVGIVYGRWGSGKSFFAFDLGLHVAHGMPMWHAAALPGAPLPVLYIANEGESGFVDRAEAFRRHHGLEDHTDLFRLIVEPINFSRDEIFKAAKARIAQEGIKYSLVVIDTVGRALAGVDSNTQESVSLFMERCRELGKLTGATVIGIHHENKTGTMLGSIVFENDADFVYHVTKDDDGRALSTGEILCTKLKEGTDNWTAKMTFAAQELDVDEDGELRHSLVVSSIGNRSDGVTSQTKSPKAAITRSGFTVTESKVRRFLAELQKAWDKGEPWNPFPQSKTFGRHVDQHAMRIFQLSRNKCQDLVGMWIAANYFSLDVRNSTTKQRGFKLNRPIDEIIRDLENDPAEVAEVAEVDAEVPGGTAVSH